MSRRLLQMSLYLVLAGLPGAGLLPDVSSVRAQNAPASAGAVADYQARLAQYQAARDAYETEASAYWDAVATKRRLRNANRRDHLPISLDDYVLTQPPLYSGPSRPIDPRAPAPPPPERPEIPVVADFLKNAAEQFGFVPDRPANELDFKRAYVKLGPLCSCPVTEITARLRSTDLVQRFETGRIAAEPFVAELSGLLGLKTTYGEFCDLWTSVFFEDTLVPESLIAGLRGRHRLLVLSNTNPIHFSMLRERYGVFRHFDSFVLSYEVGALKPDAEIYREAIERAEPN